MDQLKELALQYFNEITELDDSNYEERERINNRYDQQVQALNVTMYKVSDDTGEIETHKVMTININKKDEHTPPGEAIEYLNAERETLYDNTHEAYKVFVKEQKESIKFTKDLIKENRADLRKHKEHLTKALSFLGR